MKKFLAVFLSIIMIFSAFSIVGFAEDEATTEVENTTRNILNDDGLVVPINFTQLKSSVIFKIFEKIFKAILRLFAGDDADDLDASIAEGISSLGDEISKAIEEGAQFLDNNQDE